jgi:hypothetical protein
MKDSKGSAGAACYFLALCLIGQVQKKKTLQYRSGQGAFS